MPPETKYAKPLSVQPGRLIREHDEPIKVGTMLWVYTDPHKGHEFAYNRWYERDHYYAGCMIGAGNFAGSRWVAPRSHKDLRLPTEPQPPYPPSGAGSYACLYYVLDGGHEAWLGWATEQVNALYAADRGFQGRTHYNTSTWHHERRAYRDADPLPLELALDHRYPGMVAWFVTPTAGTDDATLDAWFDDKLPGWLDGSPVASVSSWSEIPLLDTKPDFVPVSDSAVRPRLLIQFLECDPADAWDQERALVADLEGSGLATVDLAAPFLATDMGTDRYIDELW